MYILYIRTRSLPRYYKVRGFSSSSIYSMVIASWSIYVILTFGQVFRVKYLMGLPPKLKLLAVFSGSDMYVYSRSRTAVKRNVGV